MLKVELEKIVKEQTTEIKKLKNLIQDSCQEAIEELDPCSEGLEFINNVLAKAGLPERQIDVELTIRLYITPSAMKFIEGCEEDKLKLVINDKTFPIDDLIEITEM